MSKIVNRDAGSVTTTFAVDTELLGSVILTDDIRPVMDGAAHVRSRFTNERQWIANLMVPGMETRDASGTLVPVLLRMEGEGVPELSGPCLVRLDGATVSATTTRTSGGNRASLSIRARNVAETQVEPLSTGRSGIPIVLPDQVLWLGAAPAKGFGGAPRTEANVPVFVHQLLLLEEATRRPDEHGQVRSFVSKRPLSVELVGHDGAQLRTLARVSIDGAGAQLTSDDLGRSARITVTAKAIRPYVAPVVSRPRRSEPTPVETPVA